MPRRALLAVAVVGWLAVLAGGAGALPARTGDVANDAGLQWGFDRMGTEAAWTRSNGSGVTIAVVDSGASMDHEDLAGNIVGGTACRGTEGDPGRCGGDPADDDGHGTHVAGIAGAVAGNGVGIAGIAPGADLLVVKVLFRDCDTCQSSGSSADVIAGIRWAIGQGADVINLSLGSTASSVFGPGFGVAVREAWEAGAIPVVAAGNELVLTADFGDAPAVVVSATDRNDGAPSYSSGVGDARWALAAPGGEGGDTEASCSQDGAPVGILSTFWAADDDAAYACLSGTSMAAPHVSGALAVLLGAGLTPTEAVDALLSTATDLGPPGPDTVFGAGRVDLAAAADTVEATIAARPAEPTTPATVAPSSATTGPVPTVPTTVPATTVPAPVDDLPEETSSPQPFEPVAADSPAPALVAGAAAAIAANAAGAVLLARRRR